MEAPGRLSAAGWAAAWAYGVRTVVDLRDADECEPDRAPRPAGITTVQVPLDPVGTPFYEHWTEIDNLSSPLYFPAMLAEYPERVVAAVRAIASAALGFVVFHCAGGKDRTGLLALVLLTLAGAAPEEIIADYLLTYDRMKPRYDEIGVGACPGSTSSVSNGAVSPGFDSWAGFLGCGWDDGAGQRVSASGKLRKCLVTRFRRLHCAHLG
jgi:protein-tyrosine phosphatase